MTDARAEIERARQVVEAARAVLAEIEEGIDRVREAGGSIALSQAYLDLREALSRFDAEANR